LKKLFSTKTVMQTNLSEDYNLTKLNAIECFLENQERWDLSNFFGLLLKLDTNFDLEAPISHCGSTLSFVITYKRQPVFTCKLVLGDVIEITVGLINKFAHLRSATINKDESPTNNMRTTNIYRSNRATHNTQFYVHLCRHYPSVEDFSVLF
jgi:hypothetical protein